MRRDKKCRCEPYSHRKSWSRSNGCDLLFRLCFTNFEMMDALSRSFQSKIRKVQPAFFPLFVLNVCTIRLPKHTIFNYTDTLHQFMIQIKNFLFSSDSVHAQRRHSEDCFCFPSVIFFFTTVRRESMEVILQQKRTCILNLTVFIKRSVVFTEKFIF